MAKIACFLRNRCTSVEQITDRTIQAACTLQDTITEAVVRITVKLPDLEIIDLDLEVRRPSGCDPSHQLKSLKRTIGARVGPGIKKIIKGVSGTSPIEREIAFMVEECCEGVILMFTKDVLCKAPKDILGEKEYFVQMVKDNPRLYDSCAALSPQSPLMAGVKRPT